MCLVSGGQGAPPIGPSDYLPVGAARLLAARLGSMVADELSEREGVELRLLCLVVPCNTARYVSTQ